MYPIGRIVPSSEVRMRICCCTLIKIALKTSNLKSKKPSNSTLSTKTTRQCNFSFIFPCGKIVEKLLTYYDSLCRSGVENGGDDTDIPILKEMSNVELLCHCVVVFGSGETIGFEDSKLSPMANIRLETLQQVKTN